MRRNPGENELEEQARRELREILSEPVGSVTTERRSRAREFVGNSLSRIDAGDDDMDVLAEITSLPEEELRFTYEDPDLHQRQTSLAMRVNSRREAIVEAGKTFGVTAELPEERGRQAARLTPTEAARWVGRDVAVVKFFDSAVWNAVQEPLRRFVAVAKRRKGKATTRAEPEEKDRAVAAVVSPEELAVLDSIAKEPSVLGSSAREAAKEVKKAKSRAEAQDRKFVKTMRGMASRVRGARDSEERSELQKNFMDELVTVQARTALSRIEWMRVARAGGLGPMEVADALRIMAAEARPFSRSLGSNSHAMG